MELTRDRAWALLTEYTQSDSLRKHALAVEAALRAYARRFGEDEEVWGFVGLIHDFDYERWPPVSDRAAVLTEGLQDCRRPSVGGPGGVGDPRRARGREADVHGFARPERYLSHFPFVSGKDPMPWKKS